METNDVESVPLHTLRRPRRLSSDCPSTMVPSTESQRHDAGDGQSCILLLMYLATAQYAGLVEF